MEKLTQNDFPKWYASKKCIFLLRGFLSFVGFILRVAFTASDIVNGSLVNLNLNIVNQL